MAEHVLRARMGGELGKFVKKAGSEKIRKRTPLALVSFEKPGGILV
jgi:hypothetical protein